MTDVIAVTPGGPCGELTRGCFVAHRAGLPLPGGRNEARGCIGPVMEVTTPRGRTAAFSERRVALKNTSVLFDQQIED